MMKRYKTETKQIVCFFMELLANNIHFLIPCIVDFKENGSKQNRFSMCQTLIFQEALCY